jgi:hypothetical protein
MKMGYKKVYSNRLKTLSVMICKICGGGNQKVLDIKF